MKRFKTDYPGVYFIIGTSPATGKQERIYYIRYRRGGKMVEEKAGRQIEDDMTPARAYQKRAQKMAGKLLSNEEKREAERAENEAADGRWTVDRLFKEYIKHRRPGKSLEVDSKRYEKYLKDAYGPKEPKDILPLDTDRLRISLLKTKSPQTVKHILNLLTWIVNFGTKKGLAAGLSFKIEKPLVDNLRTEHLSPDEMKRLLEAIDADEDKNVGNLMKLALFSGMRRGELFNLQWRDIDLERGFLTIRDPKGVRDQIIPINETTRAVLSDQKQVKGGSSYIFSGKNGEKRVSVQFVANRIKAAAGLPKDFRPLHGLRHSFASALASSGKVDMYHLQRLLTHKSPIMTQRYAHLRDDALKRASNVVNDVVNEALKPKDKEDKIIMLDNKQ
jgi:integrase